MNEFENVRLVSLPRDQYDRLKEAGYDVSAWTPVDRITKPDLDKPVRFVNRAARRAAAKKRRRA